MRINILKDGDEVISVNPGFIAVRRVNHEVDLIPFMNDPNTGLRIDSEKIVTIGYGDNEITTQAEDGTIITNF